MAEILKAVILLAISCVVLVMALATIVLIIRKLMRRNRASGFYYWSMKRLYKESLK